MEIIIERGKVSKLEELPEYSIAVDGRVSGPQIDDEHHRYSFDHHGGCSRFSTISACEQAWNACLLGLMPDKYTVYCNDVDADVCTAIWCLKNPERCKEPLAKKLVDAIGLSDRYAGAFDVNGMKKIVEWISAPETESKRNGDYEKLSNEGLKPILESILHRIDTYVAGEASIEIAKHEVHEDFKMLRNENGWTLVESQDPHALGAIWQAGFQRIVVVRPLEDGSTAVTLARRSDFIEGFPLQKLYKALNVLEPGWGGSNTIGGAPRNEDGSRSRLPIETIINVVDEVLGFKEAEEEKKKKPRTAKKKTPTKKKSS